MNINVQRIDGGAKLTEAELDAAIQASWPARRVTVAQPIAAECCTEEGADDEPKLPRNAVTAADLLALLLILVIGGSVVIFALVTGWRLARGLFS